MQYPFATKSAPKVGAGFGGLPNSSSAETVGGLNVKKSTIVTGITGYTQVSPGFTPDDWDKVFISTVSRNSVSTNNNDVTKVVNVPLAAVHKDYTFQITSISSNVELALIGPKSSMVLNNTVLHSETTATTTTVFGFTEVSNKIINQQFFDVSLNVSGTLTFSLDKPIKNLSKAYIVLHPFYASSGNRQVAIDAGCVDSLDRIVCSSAYAYSKQFAYMSDNSTIKLNVIDGGVTNYMFNLGIVEFE